MPEFIPTPFEMIILNSPPRFLNEILKEQKKKIQRKKYYAENIESRRAKRKEYYYKNIEQEREKGRKYYQDNIEMCREKNNKRKEENREVINEKARKYAKDHPEKIRERMKKYRNKYPEKEKQRKRDWEKKNPDKHIKSKRKTAWKERGLNMENFEEIYQIYLSTSHCDLCGVELTEDQVNTKTTRCMDHSHVTGEFRNIVCCSCNSRLPQNT